MAVDLSVLDEPKSSVDLSVLDNPQLSAGASTFNKKPKIDLSALYSSDPSAGDIVKTQCPTGYTLNNDTGLCEPTDPSAGDIVKGVGVEVGAGIGGSVLGGIIGGTLGSAFFGIGAVPGAAIGASLGGATASFFGSLLAQDIEGQEDKSMGRAIAAAAIGAIPGGVGKGIKGGMTLGKVATREAAKGAAFGVTDATARAVIDEGRLPTAGELAQFGGAGALFGGALGGVTTKIGQKFAGKTPQQIDEAIAREEITFKDLSFFPKDIPDTRKIPPLMPETRVTGEDGKPLIVYRGLRGEEGLTEGLGGRPASFTESKDIATIYSSKPNPDPFSLDPAKFTPTSNVNEVYLNIKKPLDFTNSGAEMDLGEYLDILSYGEKGGITDDEVVELLRYIQSRGRGKDAAKDNFKFELSEIFKPKEGKALDFSKDEFSPFDELIDEIAPESRFDFTAASDEIREALLIDAFVLADAPVTKKVGQRLGNDGIIHIDAFGGDVEAPNLLGKKAEDVKGLAEESSRYTPEQGSFPERVNKTHVTHRPFSEDQVIPVSKTAKEKPTAQTPTMEGIILRGIQETKDGTRSRAAAQALTQPRANLGTMGKILASVAPSKFVGTKAQQATIDFSRIIKTAEEISGRIGAKTARAIKKNPSLEAPINRFLDTGEMSDDVAKVLGADLTKYDEARQALQKEAIQLIDDGAYKSLDDEAREKLRQTIDDSMNSSQLYARREYKAFLDPNYKPTPQQRQAVMNELVEAGVKRGEDFKTASTNANEHLDRLEKAFASTRREDPRGLLGNGIDSVFKKRKTPGEAEKIWLGEIKDPVERMRGTLTGVAKSVARERTNVILGKELVDAGIASTTKVDNEMVELVLRGTGKEGSGLFAYPQVQTALNELYVGNGSEKMDNIFLNGLQDLYRAGVGLSKGVKVLFNTVAYPVQVYGNTANLLGMGINPFKNSSRGLRLALADVPLVSRAMEGLDKTPKARKALLDEIEEMSKYGIKNANILESDIRSTLDAGPFSKWLQKGLDPVGKAYQVPDTLGRYVGWKANQNTVRKMFPNASDEVVKKQAAMMINDTYQNYDKLSNVVRTLSRWGVMPQFASFTSEFARNQYNQGKMIARMIAGNFGEEFSELGAANVTRMRVEGSKRLASLLGVYGGTYAAIEGVKAASGVDDKKEEALRDVAYAPWDKNRKQLVKLDEGGRTGWVANPSYVVPHALGLSALQAGLSGDSEQSVIALMAEEFIGEGSFVFQSAYQALANRDERGELISKEVDKLDQARERLGFFLTESFRPGFSRELKKLEKARLGKGDLTLKEVGARQLGARINPFDVGEAAMFTIRNTNTLSNEAKSDYNSLLKFGEASEAELNQAYEKANKIYSDAFAALSKNNESLITLGYDENERIEIFKNAKVSSKRVLEILDNSPSDLPRALKQSTSDIYNEQGDTMQQKRSNIKKYMRTDPSMGKKLMNMWIREQKNASRGLNQKDTLIRNMDTDEKVDYLSRNPGMINDFRRKGVLSDSVLQALRIRGVL